MYALVKGVLEQLIKGIRKNDGQYTFKLLCARILELSSNDGRNAVVGFGLFREAILWKMISF